MKLCRTCFKVEATASDWEIIPEGGGDWLCWGDCDDMRDERIDALEAAIRHVWDDTEDTPIDAEYLADFQVEVRAAWDACCKLGDQ